MTRSRKSQRKLERKEDYSYLKRSSENPIYLGYFGGLLWDLEDDFALNERRMKWWLGHKLAEAYSDIQDVRGRRVFDALTSREIFDIIKQYENRSLQGLSANSRRVYEMAESEYPAFLELSERLSYGYVLYAEYLLRKEWRRSGRRETAFDTIIRNQTQDPIQWVSIIWVNDCDSVYYK